ncbi:MAG: NusA-like transcription termination signal-binding factor [Methanomicrobiaceae archaeon]|nr:NusA-like transcription termination signal-binding factor [Methanomicrobiaceae archaeon]
MHRTLGFKERRYIEELRILTKSTAIDCIIDDQFDRVIYVIKKGDMGMAIGKHGDNIRKMQRVLGKRIEMVEEASEPESFIANIFKPVEVGGLKKDETTGKRDVIIRKKADLGIAIGKGGANIEKARILSRRCFGIDIGEIVVEKEPERDEHERMQRT